MFVKRRTGLVPGDHRCCCPVFSDYSVADVKHNDVTNTTNANHPGPRDLVLATLAPFSSVYVQPTTGYNVIFLECTRTAMCTKSLVDPHHLYNFCVGVPSLWLNECGRIPCIISHTTNANHPGPRDLVLATLAPFSAVYVQPTTGYNVIFRECTRTSVCTKSLVEPHPSVNFCLKRLLLRSHLSNSI